VLSEENSEQVRAFTARHPEFSILPPAQTVAALWDKADDFAAAALGSPEGFLMTPRRTGTDGFFVSVLRRTSLSGLRQSRARPGHQRFCFPTSPKGVDGRVKPGHDGLREGCEPAFRRVSAVHDSRIQSPRVADVLRGLGA